MNPAIGSWELTMKTPIGSITATYTFTDDAGSLQGEARGKAETVTLEDLTAVTTDDGSTALRWRQRVTKPMRLNLEFEVTVTGDTMTGFSRAGKLPRSQVTGGRIGT